MKATRKIVEINEELCTGCGDCVNACAEGAIELINGKAKLVAEKYCDGLGACLGECPANALTVTERESEEFDPEAVEHHLKEREVAKVFTEIKGTMPCGCPSKNIEMFTPCQQANQPTSMTDAPAQSALGHWPVQIRLVPPTAPFLRGADLLVAADCTPVAYPAFHRDLLPGKAVMIGCPKFDDADEYVEKFAEVFRVADIKSVTVVEMEVPCCSKLPMIVRKGLQLSGKQIPFEEVIIGRRGEIVSREKAVA